jgi:hypothetical protein
MSAFVAYHHFKFAGNRCGKSLCSRRSGSVEGYFLTLNVHCINRQTNNFVKYRKQAP